MTDISCIICLEGLLSDANNIVAAPCGHVFHMPCITNWLERQAKCPVCKALTRGKSLFKLFLGLETAVASENPNVSGDGAGSSDVTSEDVSATLQELRVKLDIAERARKSALDAVAKARESETKNEELRKQLNDKLVELERAVFKYQLDIHKLEQQNDELTCEVAALKKKCTGHEKKLAQAEFVLALEKVDDKVPFDPVRFSEKLDPEEKLKQMAAFLTFHKSSYAKVLADYRSLEQDRDADALEHENEMKQMRIMISKLRHRVHELSAARPVAAVTPSSASAGAMTGSHRREQHRKDGRASEGVQLQQPQPQPQPHAVTSHKPIRSRTSVSEHPTPATPIAAPSPALLLPTPPQPQPPQAQFLTVRSTVSGGKHPVNPLLLIESSSDDEISAITARPRNPDTVRLGDRGKSANGREADRQVLDLDEDDTDGDHSLDLWNSHNAPRLSTASPGAGGATEFSLQSSHTSAQVPSTRLGSTTFAGLVVPPPASHSGSNSTSVSVADAAARGARQQQQRQRERDRDWENGDVLGGMHEDESAVGEQGSDGETARLLDLVDQPDSFTPPKRFKHSHQQQKQLQRRAAVEVAEDDLHFDEENTGESDNGLLRDDGETENEEPPEHSAVDMTQMIRDAVSIAKERHPSAAGNAASSAATPATTSVVMKRAVHSVGVSGDATRFTLVNTVHQPAMRTHSFASVAAKSKAPKPRPAESSSLVVGGKRPTSTAAQRPMAKRAGSGMHRTLDGFFGTA